MAIPSPSVEDASAVPHPESITNELVARCKQGDTQAFRELFRRFRHDVVQIIFHVAAPSEADLEDLVQEVFLQVHRSIGRFDGRSKFSTWLYRVTVNVVLMHLRAQRSRPQLSDPLPEGLMADDGRPDEGAMRSQRLQAFHRVLDELPEKKRTVFVLHELQGLAPKEIAKIVGAPVVTVRTRLYYARKQLVELLDKEPALAPYAHLLERGLQSGSNPRGEGGAK